ncbi:hypothetical protein [Psychrobacillus sp.]|uniref:hypothetical protein n=1 Tax=Psychrobacillus sp. TaxID=1871623 RepID=UPI0028BF2AF2|nr:hypothetical protein [Psychrobacillus sp.]
MLENLFVVLRLAYVLIFFLAMYWTFKFEWGSEGKDERGRSISQQSYSIVFPLIPLGWLLIELYNDYISALDYSAYKSAIWFLLTGLYILHAINITILKRKY